MKKLFLIIVPILICFLAVIFNSDRIRQQSVIWFPTQQNHALTGNNVAVLYKVNDPLSKEVAEYYAEQRDIPSSQLMGVHIKGNPKKISREQFIGSQLAARPLVSQVCRV